MSVNEHECKMNGVVSKGTVTTHATTLYVIQVLPCHTSSMHAIVDRRTYTMMVDVGHVGVMGHTFGVNIW